MITKIFDNTKDEVFCSLDDVVLTYKDIKTLLPRTWLSENIVRAFLHLFPCIDGVHITSPNFYAELQESFGMLPAALDKMIIPVHWYNSHWLAICVNFSTASISLYDSRVGFAPEADVLSPVHAFIAHAQEARQEKRVKFSVRVEKVPQ